jgi:hypothetical protein
MDADKQAELGKRHEELLKSVSFFENTMKRIMEKPLPSAADEAMLSTVATDMAKKLDAMFALAHETGVLIMAMTDPVIHQAAFHVTWQIAMRQPRPEGTPPNVPHFQSALEASSGKK